MSKHFPRKNKWDVRKDVYNKFNGHCAYCGDKITMLYFEVDHVIPRKQCKEGCLWLIGNLYPSCKQCNILKSNHSIEEFREAYRIKNGLSHFIFYYERGR